MTLLPPSGSGRWKPPTGVSAARGRVHGGSINRAAAARPLQILQRLILNYRHYQFVAAGKHLQFHMVLMWGPQRCPEALWEPQDIKNMSVTTLVSVPFEAVFPPQTLCQLRSLCPSLRISLCVMGPWHQTQASCNPRGSAVCWMSRRENQMHLKVLKSHYLSKKYLFRKLYFFKWGEEKEVEHDWTKTDRQKSSKSRMLIWHIMLPVRFAAINGLNKWCTCFLPLRSAGSCQDWRALPSVPTTSRPRWEKHVNAMFSIHRTGQNMPDNIKKQNRGINFEFWPWKPATSTSFQVGRSNTGLVTIFTGEKKKTDL